MTTTRAEKIKELLHFFTSNSGGGKFQKRPEKLQRDTQRPPRRNQYRSSKRRRGREKNSVRPNSKSIALKRRELVFEYLLILQNCLIKNGKKARTARWVQKILHTFLKKFPFKKAYLIMYFLFLRMTPRIYLRKFHVGRTMRTVGLPLLHHKRRHALAKLLIKAARTRSEKGFGRKLVAEMLDLFRGKKYAPSLVALKQLYFTAKSNKSNARFLRFLNSRAL